MKNNHSNVYYRMGVLLDLMRQAGIDISDFAIDFGLDDIDNDLCDRIYNAAILCEERIICFLNLIHIAQKENDIKYGNN